MNANRHQCNNMGIKNKHVEGERKVGDKLTLQFNCVVIMTDENCDYTCTSCCYVQGGVCVVCVCVCFCFCGVCVCVFLWCVCVCVSVCLCFCGVCVLRHSCFICKFTQVSLQTWDKYLIEDTSYI